jgi:integrase/recombinase XerD
VPLNPDPKQTDAGMVRELASLIRRNHLTYDRFNRLCMRARKLTALKPARRGHRLTQLLTADQLRAGMEAIERHEFGGSDSASPRTKYSRLTDSHVMRNTIIMRMLFYTGVRVAELAAMRIADVDLAAGKVFISEGKGGKDRYVLFLNDFRLVLRTYISSLPEGEEWLFPSAYRRPISTRWVRMIVAGVGRQVGVHMRPHLFRHQLLTHLTKEGVPTAMIQLISGHSSPDSLAHYQQMALPDVQAKYEDAVGKVKL